MSGPLAQMRSATRVRAAGFPTLMTRPMVHDAGRSAVARCMIVRLSGGMRLSAPCRMTSNRSASMVKSS
jgi:hypothetical protein